MKDVMELLSRLMFQNYSPLNQSKGPILLRLGANLTAFFLLVFGYVLGCKVLYDYISPSWGEELSLLAISGVLILTSSILFMVAWFLKPKKPQPIALISEIEKTIREIPNHEIIRKVASMISPKAVMAVFTVAVMVSYFSNFKKHI